MQRDRWTSLAGVFLVVVITLVLTGCTTTDNKVTEEATYTIGSVGPAGGLVFFDKGDASGGWQYMEAAPADTEMLARWGTTGLEVETSTNLGSGKTNTQELVEQDPAWNETAAVYCTNLMAGGYNDWFLPSKDELSLLFSALARTNRDTFRGEGFAYWSSSSYDGERAWAQGFSNGVQGKVEKEELLVVRAVRVF
ncbi:DUF1566 domain-containing protein [uncultured Sphaerochaeta sp.]|uniref:Lcl domain-containing protein n=1 Tax=uncultured Sphaerochaeta sp. TaxID=886478 RepID=UPI0029CA9AA6|nr:DUF1566 domain-containing protein [uncultured Sphaerochaeta sp.]